MVVTRYVASLGWVQLEVTVSSWWFSLVWFVVFDPFFSGESANAVESCPLSMGSLMPLSGVSSAELFVTDTAAVDL